MKRTMIINDLHLGVKRQGGTTRESRIGLEKWMMQQFKQLLLVLEDDTGLIILGDLFDRRNVDEHIMMEVISLISPIAGHCTIVAGNHDLGGIKDRTMSSAEFVARMSGAKWIDRPAQVNGLHIIPHLHDQQAFDRAVQDIPEGSTLLVHCNIDSPFAHSDHSLNLSKEQVVSLRGKGVNVIAGHEHAMRRYMDSVIVIGNQFPSSIADCKGGDKYAAILDGELSFIKTWDANNYLKVDWKADIGHTKQFTEVTGECDVESFPSIVRRVSDIRKNSDAFIVKNAVKVEESETHLTEDEVTAFNITEMFMSQLPDGIREKVKAIC